jgi:transmembrane sensor
MTPKELTYLIEQYTQGSISAEEQAALEAFLANVDMQVISDDLVKEWLEQSKTVNPPIGFEATIQSHLHTIFSADKNLDYSNDSNLNEVITTPPVHRVHFLRTAWVRYAAAIIIILSTGAYLWNTQQKDKPLITETKRVPVKNDILPGSDRAVLTLSTGQQVILDSAASETIKDGTLSIKNNNGQLIYKQGDRVAMNTMSTPKGGHYQLTLADGTKVWLNAASSITYPTAFVGTLREVSITGEAYFEVTRNPKQPFVVKTSKEAVTVLGTSFNVNAYADEPAMKTSLLEGAVKVGNSFLRPGQAYLNGKVVPTNLDQDLAWKNGAFNFQGMDLTAAFRLLGRWYSVDVEYSGALPTKKIRGEIGRNLSLSEVLKTLSELGIHTRIEGTTLVVLPD